MAVAGRSTSVKQQEMKNRFRKALDDYLEQHEISPEELYKRFNVSGDYFRSARNNFPDDPKCQKPFTLSFVSKIVAFCGIPAATFLLNEKEIANWRHHKAPHENEKRYYLRATDLKATHTEESSRVILDLHYTPLDKHTRDEFAKKYVDAVRPYIKKATASIIISEFLGKGSFKDPGVILDGYQEAHKKLFREIEQQLKENPELEYNRVLRLPADRYYSLATPREKVIEAIQYCSVTGFAHLYRCLLKFEKRVKFCVAPVTHFLSFGLLEGEVKILVCEQFKYIHDDGFDPKDIILPATLNIEEWESHIHPLNEMWQLYHQEMKSWQWRPNMHITRSNILGLTNQAFEEIKKGSSDIVNDLEPGVLDALQQNMKTKLDFLRDFKV